MQTNFEEWIKGYAPFTSMSVIWDQTNPMETDWQYFLTETITVVTVPETAHLHSFDISWHCWCGNEKRLKLLKYGEWVNKQLVLVFNAGT